jgi:hypothetical protein
VAVPTKCGPLAQLSGNFLAANTTQCATTMCDAMDNWAFTESFRRADLARVRKLERAPPFEAVVEAILALRPTVDRIGLRQHPTIGPRRQRVELCIRAKRDLVDAFFNGPNGYRAEFLRGDLEAALSIDRRVVDRIAAAYNNELRSVPGGWKSIASPQAKVWIRQNRQQTEALYGRTRPVPDIDVPSWIERMDAAVPTPRGLRWLARAGVIASLGREAIDVKGGWLEGGELVEDAYKKESRGQQIRTYGFT